MKHWILTTSLLLLALTVNAVPAKRISQVVRLADGSTTTIHLCGDEFCHYWMTPDGTPVFETESGNWEVDHRDLQALRQARAERQRRARLQRLPKIRRAMRASAPPYLTTETTTKRGLLILVNFKNKNMTYGENAVGIFNQMLNAIGDPFEKNHGSVREFFRDQSYGQFDIEFDVMGPVTVSQNMEYYGKDQGGEGYDAHPGEMVAEACKLVDEQVNFADYDWDGDGEVENIYIIYAGYAQSSGAPSYTIWPHQWNLSDEDNYGKALKLDGVTVDTYACGSELYGSSGKEIDGVGTMCHEYSHCLGLPDFYDTTYKALGMTSWSIMDAGCYNGDGFCPAGYTAYERWFCGWLTPVELNAETVVKDMKNIEENAEAYIIYNDNSKDEYYILANHQLVGWDKEAYGHGMMVLHVDYDQTAWEENTINNTASHQRMTLIPADGKFAEGSSVEAHKKELGGDLWPGTKYNTELTDETTPAATLYRANSDGQKLMHKPITNISETEGLISFSFMKAIVHVDAPVLSSSFENVDTASFTATWSKVDAAVSYNIVLTEKESNGSNEIMEAMNLSEDFEGFFIEDEDATSDGSKDISSSLDEYTIEPGWTGEKIYQGLFGAKLATSKAAGVITTPIIEGKTGTMTLFLDAYDWFNYNTYNTQGTYRTDGTKLIVSLLDAEGKELKQFEVTPNDFASDDYEMCVLNFSDMPEKYQVRVATNGAKKRAYLNYLFTFDGTFSEDDVLLLFEEEEDDDYEVKGETVLKTPFRTRHNKMKSIARSMARRNEKTIFTAITDTTYTFQELTPGASYEVQVQAVDAEGNTSDYSNTESITLPNGFYVAISNVKPAAQSCQSTFDLMGRSVAASLRGGLYIINGKKVFIK